MNSRDIKNNEDLYEYIYWLAQQLRKRGQDSLSDKLVAANDFVFGSQSEFLHEADCALKEVAASPDAKIFDTEREDVIAMICLIDEAFKKVGGA